MTLWASRRSTLAGLGGLAFASDSIAHTPAHRVFVGTVTMTPDEGLPAAFGSRMGQSEGVYTFLLDTNTGEAGPLHLAARASNPFNLIADSRRRRLYVCHGMTTAVDGQSPITAFAVEGNRLRELNFVRSGGSGPTHGVVDRRGRHLLTTNYATSSIVAFRLSQGGALGERTAYIGGPEPTEQPPLRAPGEVAAAPSLGEVRTKPHIIILSQSGRFAIVAEIDTNRCAVFRYNAQTGALTPHASVEAAPGAGPRHLALHPNGRYIYSSDENAATVSAWRWCERDGMLSFISSLPLAPPSFTGSNHPADVAVHPTGRFVYVSNRGGRAVSGFRIEEDGATLAPLPEFDIPNDHCWCLEFDPSGRWLLAAMQPRDEIAVFAVDRATGALTQHRSIGPVIMPTCLALF